MVEFEYLGKRYVIPGPRFSSLRGHTHTVHIQLEGWKGSFIKVTFGQEQGDCTIGPVSEAPDADCSLLHASEY